MAVFLHHKRSKDDNDKTPAYSTSSFEAITRTDDNEMYSVQNGGSLSSLGSSQSNLIVFILKKLISYVLISGE